MTDLLELGYLVRDAREAKRMKQRELGALVGLSGASISLLETGRIVNPKLSLLERLAEVLEIPIGDMLEKAGVTLPDAETGQLSWVLGQLDPHNRRRLVGIAHALLQVQQDPPRRGST